MRNIIITALISATVAAAHAAITATEGYVDLRVSVVALDGTNYSNTVAVGLSNRVAEAALQGTQHVASVAAGLTNAITQSVSTQRVTRIYNATNALEWYEILGKEKWTYTVTTHSNLWSYSCADIYSLENTNTLIAHAQSGFFETNNPPLHDNFPIITPIKSIDDRFFFFVNFGGSWIFFSPDQEFHEATGNNEIGDYSCSWGDVKFKWLGNGFTLTNITVSTLSTTSDLSSHNSDETAHPSLFGPITNKTLQRVSAAGPTTIDLSGSRPTLVTLTSNATLQVVGLYPYYPSYLIVQGDYSWSFSNATYTVGGSLYITNMANHMLIWQASTNMLVSPITATEVIP